MKALTIYQPWASLIAVGAKTIETRPRGTDYRGPLAIHAGLRKPSLAEAGIVVDNLDAWNLWYAHYRSPDLGVMPLGAVVASARLVDVVPIVERVPRLTRAVQTFPDGRLLLWPTHGIEPTNVESERPFGDFSPGRFAWLLDDVAPTTERCPWCWGVGVVRCSLPRHHDGACNVGPLISDGLADCPVCAGAGKCDPVPASGRQAAPFEWIPTQLAMPPA